MLYHLVFVGICIGLLYWVNRRWGGRLRGNYFFTKWRQSMLIYRRRLLKRARSRTPPPALPLISSGSVSVAVDNISATDDAGVDAVDSLLIVGSHHHQQQQQQNPTSTHLPGHSVQVLESRNEATNMMTMNTAAMVAPVMTTAPTSAGGSGSELKSVLSMNADDYRKGSLFLGESIELEFTLPDLVGPTEILTEDHREKLCGHLPARAEGYSWSLVFSTSLHGFSLNSLYRKMYRLESPILIVIQDTDNNVFGALTSCSLHVSDHFYGTGESLLYKFNPSFKVFHWTGENLYFIKGNPESLSIGAGDGKFGLWLDGDLNQGRTQPCSTYSNEHLTQHEDFVVKTIECWAFV